MTAKSSDLQGYETRQRTMPRYNRVIIIDDSEIDLEVENIIMKGINLAKTIDLRLNGEEVIQELSNIKRLDEVPELIFLDLNMPVKDGREVLSELKNDELLKKIPIIIYTTSSNKSEKEETLQQGAVSWITKPHSVTGISEVIAEILEKFNKL